MIDFTHEYALWIRLKEKVYVCSMQHHWHQHNQNKGILCPREFTTWLTSYLLVN
jgi:hypothetical protein